MMTTSLIDIYLSEMYDQRPVVMGKNDMYYSSSGMRLKAVSVQ